ncbi:MAG TPA: ribosome assembly RNA-binding protein YhbY [Candidatus Thioglobus sp.]|jgi:RNA-binding protein|nr:ribosome assembly RNA-binding protein YhbY [Candidatus Thioglobus sp.]HIL41806.1 ribosome assembly RNA-binding protein YhbY [Gammaproteobacteria bacterium]
MNNLTNNQKKYLRSLGHHLKPVVMVGQNGLSEAVLLELESTMEKHELLKIKIRTEDRDEKHKMIDKIVDYSKSNLVQVVGNIVLIYRPFKEESKIVLPRK